MKFRSFVFPFLCALFLVFAWRNQEQANTFWQVLQRARLLPLLVATLLQVGTLLNQPALFQSLYRLVGIEVNWAELVPVVWAGRFINVVTPAAGLGETALLFNQARQRGWDLGRIALVTTLYFALNFAVFSLILIVGFAFLAVKGDLRRYEILTALPLVTGLALGAAAMIWVAKKPDLPEIWAQKLAIRLPPRWRKAIAVLEATGETARGFAQSIQELRGARRSWTEPIVHAILVDALEIAVLGACLWAFSVPVSLLILVSGYVVGTLFTIVSISPQGLGAVEGALGATLVSLGVPLPQATAVVLTYRGLSFWLPLMVGFGATRYWSKSLANEGTPSVNTPSATI